MPEASLIGYLYITVTKCLTGRTHRKRNVFWFSEESAHHGRDGMTGSSSDIMTDEEAKHKMGSNQRSPPRAWHQ